MKSHIKEQEIISERFLRLPIIQKCEVCKKTQDGFIVEIELNDGHGFDLNVIIMDEAYPSKVSDKIRTFADNDRREYPVIIAPYISDVTADICQKCQVGYFDHAGNALFCNHSIYISEKGNKNTNPNRRSLNSVFERSSEISSLILRELFNDISQKWKLKYLSEKVGCSIGQVSKVKDFLCRNLWAEMTSEGLVLIEPEKVLSEWSKIYGRKCSASYSCYSLDNPFDIERKLMKLKEKTGINYYLTGFSGGVRYTPVVRYNRVHVYIYEDEIKEVLEQLDCKETSSGQNLIIYPIDEACCIKYARTLDGYSIVSPVQVYLDCMQIKGRGEEMAEAVMRKEIL